MSFSAHSVEQQWVSWGSVTVNSTQSVRLGQPSQHKAQEDQRPDFLTMSLKASPTLALGKSVWKAGI